MRWLVLLALTGCGILDPDPDAEKRADPCYSAVIYVDTLTFEPDSVVWTWTPGRCG